MSLFKKETSLFFGAALLLLGLAAAGCGRSGSDKKENDGNDTAVLDSFQPAEETKEETDSVKEYFSDDLKSFGIKGEVVERSSMRHDAHMVYPIPTNELTFDENGIFTGSLEGLFPKADENGINYSYSMNYEDGTSWELTYSEYNDEGYPVKAEIIESGPQGTAQAVLNYYGYEYDRMGNWVMRSVTCERSFVDMDTKEKTNTFRKWKELVSYKYKENNRDESE